MEYAEYQLTPKGIVRGAVISIEDTVRRQRDISELDETEREKIREDTLMIIETLGGRMMIEPRQQSLQEMIRGISAILDMADHEMRPLHTLERDAVVDAARSILLLLGQME